MPLARKEIVTEGVVGIYHCISRCVRQAFLCGKDGYTGKSYEHRKAWIKLRLHVLAEGFAVDIFSYAVMSNHVHVVIRSRPDIAESWTDEEVALQWLKLFPVGGKQNGANNNNNEAILLARNVERIKELRSRLSSISWFMRCLNEYVARLANREDGCKGRFWEGRFKCQALLDESAVLACMTYVDLNPVRAGIADAPEASLFTSIYDRIEKRKNDRIRSGDHPEYMLSEHNNHRNAGGWLALFLDEADEKQTPILDMSLDEYLNLVDWTGRHIRKDKQARIPEHMAPILSRLHIEPEYWMETVQGYGSLFHRAVGRLDSMVSAAKNVGLRWLCGVKICSRAFSPLNIK